MIKSCRQTRRTAWKQVQEYHLETPVPIMFGKSVKAGSYLYKTYKIEAELGSGGSGAVFKAWHKRLCKHVVIKVVKDGSPAAIRVHRNEVEAIKNIKSLNIPQVLDFITDGIFSFTIMEYIEGDSFDKLLKLGRIFTEQQITAWYIQMVSALKAIHKHDVCHRDIKPSNIMLAENKDIYLIDFNSALVSGNNTGVISRSMGYASPEQYEYFKMCRDILTGSSEVYNDNIETVLLVNDCKTIPVTGADISACTGLYEINWKLSDIYSLGATMYHFLTGKRPPVKADEVLKISELYGYSGKILGIIGKSMNPDPLQRFASADELNDALTDNLSVVS